MRIAAAPDRVSPPADIHVPPNGSGMHRPDRGCQCGPALLGHDLVTGANVWRHRCPTEAKPLRGEALADHLAVKRDAATHNKARDEHREALRRIEDPTL